jgi:hypothetical protein
MTEWGRKREELKYWRHKDIVASVNSNIRDSVQYKLAEKIIRPMFKDIMNEQVSVPISIQDRHIRIRPIGNAESFRIGNQVRDGIRMSTE